MGGFSGRIILQILSVLRRGLGRQEIAPCGNENSSQARIHESPGLGARELSFLPGLAWAQGGLCEDGATGMQPGAGGHDLTLNSVLVGRSPCASFFIFEDLYLPGLGLGHVEISAATVLFKKVFFLNMEKYRTCIPSLPSPAPPFSLTRAQDPLGF